MDRSLTLEVVRVTEAAALSAARLMGRGEKDAADQAAVTAMRHAFESVHANGICAFQVRLLRLKLFLLTWESRASFSLRSLFETLCRDVLVGRSPRKTALP